MSNLGSFVYWIAKVKAFSFHFLSCLFMWGFLEYFQIKISSAKQRSGASFNIWIVPIRAAFYDWPDILDTCLSRSLSSAGNKWRDLLAMLLKEHYCYWKNFLLGIYLLPRHFWSKPLFPLQQGPCLLNDQRKKEVVVVLVVVCVQKPCTLLLQFAIFARSAHCKFKISALGMGVGP